MEQEDWRNFEEKLTEKKEELQENRNQIKNLSKQIDLIRNDNNILESEALIISLTEERSAEAENIRRKDEINLNITSLKADVTNATTDIGTDWSEDRVTKIDVGKESFQNIRVLTDNLSNAEVNIEKAENIPCTGEKRTRKNLPKSFKSFHVNWIKPNR